MSESLGLRVCRLVMEPLPSFFLISFEPASEAVVFLLAGALQVSGLGKCWGALLFSEERNERGKSSVEVGGLSWVK